MRLRAAYVSVLHAALAREINVAFAGVVPHTFRCGLEPGAGEGFQSKLLTQWVDELVSGAGTDLNRPGQLQVPVHGWYLAPSLPQERRPVSHRVAEGRGRADRGKRALRQAAMTACRDTQS